MNKFTFIRCISVLFLFAGFHQYSFSQNKIDENLLKRIDKEVWHSMHKGGIPGLSLVMINGDQQIIRNYGYSDLERKRTVTSNTLFQLASCSKAFTALAVLKLAADHKINLDDRISTYLPWFYVKYKDSFPSVTIRQLLNHSSGIPWKTLSLIPEDNSREALEHTVKKIVGVKLDKLPGEQYEYTTLNYDILALIIEKTTGISFENYLQDSILAGLHLRHTTVGFPGDNNLMSAGYKIGFFKPREYVAPVFKGNNAAGYVISDAEDVADWLRFQMGLTPSALYPLAALSHQRDETVAPHGLASYAMGWEVSLSGNGEIAHDGLNPNFTTRMAFRPKQKIGVAVLANSNSGFTPFLGDRVMKLLTGEKIKNDVDPGDGNDKVFSIITIAFGVYIIFILGYLIFIISEIIRKRRRFDTVALKKPGKLLMSVLFVAPILYGIYLFPSAMGLTWNAVTVWTPISFISMIGLVSLAIVLSYISFFTLLFFPGAYQFKEQVPKIVLVSILSGIANMAIVIMITSSFNEAMALKYILFYFGVTLMIYIYGRRYVQVNLIHITRGLVYDIRIKLIDKLFSTSYQKFEKIDRGRVYATLNDDVGTVGESANMIVGFATSLVTVAGAFLYLFTVAFWATVLAIVLAISISALYFYIGKKTQVYFEEARNTQNVFMRLVNGMIDGFKEISLHRNKKVQYKNDISLATHEFKEKTTAADIKFVFAFLLGESSLIILLGLVAFGIPKVFPDFEKYTIMTFVIVLLYLNGPLGVMLNSAPALMRLKVAWSRIHAFIAEIPANLNINKPQDVIASSVQSIRTEGVTFQYQNGSATEGFSVGPIDLEVEKGQILFIIGGNGSGKTTLAKLITGLYEPDDGKIFINDKPVSGAQLSEYFSAVFSPCHLFEKLYNVELSGKSAEVKKYLKILGLSDKVEINNLQYSTINLSGGQRKRLALLQCYLEDRPIFLFDEWSADQDPEYRRFFYRELIPEMKRRGKLVIAITHDDHYFDIADKVLKMEMGKVEYVSNDFRVDTMLSN
jgi:cyclic peptide transporter